MASVPAILAARNYPETASRRTGHDQCNDQVPVDLQDQCLLNQTSLQVPVRAQYQ
jgi:hypothetical protein